MDRDEAIRVMDQLHEAGYACVVRSSNVTADHGPQFEVGVDAAGYNDADKVRLVTDIAHVNGCDAVIIVDSTPQVRAHLVISSPKDRPDYQAEESP